MYSKMGSNIIKFLLLSIFACVSSFDEFAMQRTKCISYCPHSNHLVCGTDGKTYLSQCHLSKEACEKRLDIQFAHPGECECPTSCLKNYKPCCASHKGVEKTFHNLCQFKRQRCKTKDAHVLLKYLRAGPCKPMKGWENCPRKCADIYAPVCGKNLVTYSSICALKMVACRQKKKIGLSLIGKCADNKCPEFCPFTYKKVCGSDGNAYPSQCEMKLTACKTNKTITKVPKKLAKKKCKCVLYCPDVENPVCTGHTTYLNECVLRRNYCLKKKKLPKFKQGRCEKMSNETPVKKK